MQVRTFVIRRSMKRTQHETVHGLHQPLFKARIARTLVDHSKTSIGTMATVFPPDDPKLAGLSGQDQI